MKTPLPKMGRPPKKPSTEALSEFDPARLLHNEIAAILIKSRARGRWTYADVQLLIDWFLWPENFDAIKIDVTEKQPLKIKYTLPLVSFKKNVEVTRDHVKIARALHLAKLFSQSPDELIEALPKMRKRILRYFVDSPEAKPLETFMMAQAMQNGWMKSLMEIWTKPADKLARHDVTTRTVENARSKICKMLGPDISPKKT